MLIFPVLIAVLVVVAMTRPGPNRLFRGRYRRRVRRLNPERKFPDPTIGIRDPARPL
jgi:hypothetical protein